MEEKVCRKYKECEHYDITKCLSNNKNTHDYEFICCYCDGVVLFTVDFESSYSIDPKYTLNKIFGKRVT